MEPLANDQTTGRRRLAKGGKGSPGAPSVNVGTNGGPRGDPTGTKGGSNGNQGRIQWEPREPRPTGEPRGPSVATSERMRKHRAPLAIQEHARPRLVKDCTLAHFLRTACKIANSQPPTSKNNEGGTFLPSSRAITSETEFSQPPVPQRFASDSEKSDGQKLAELKIEFP